MQRIKLLLFCVICAVFGFFSAKLVFDYIARNVKEDKTKIPPPVSSPVVSLPVEAAVTEPAQPPVVKKEPAPRPTLVLNGVVFSPPSNYALINNKIFKEGDKIEGVTVVRITKDTVEFKDTDDNAFKLSVNVKF